MRLCTQCALVSVAARQFRLPHRLKSQTHSLIEDSWFSENVRELGDGVGTVTLLMKLTVICCASKTFAVDNYSPCLTRGFHTASSHNTMMSDLTRQR